MADFPKLTMPLDLIPASRACPMLGTTAATLRRWAREGKLRTWRNPGNGWSYSLAEVHALRARMEEGK